MSSTAPTPSSPPTSSTQTRKDSRPTMPAPASPSTSTIREPLHVHNAVWDAPITMFNSSAASGLMSTLDPTSRTQMLRPQQSMWWSSADGRLYQRRYSLDRVMVFMCIGRWTKTLILKRGWPMRKASLYFSTSSGFMSTRLGLVIYRRYSAHPAPFIASKNPS